MQTRLSAGDIDLDTLRHSLQLARMRGFDSLSAWAEVVMKWAEGASAELSRLRPRPGQAHVDGDVFVTAQGRRYCVKHPAYEVNEFGKCLQCQQIEAWMKL